MLKKLAFLLMAGYFSLLPCLGFTAGFAVTPNCDVSQFNTKADKDAFGKLLFSDDKAPQQAYLKKLQACLPNNPDLQEFVDSLSVACLDQLGILPEYVQEQSAHFLADILKANAEAGFASSQHNYAVLYNAEPGSLLQQLIPQDNNTFICWSKKAAAQKEPRALFNLAVRMMSHHAPGVAYDPQEAYFILKYLQETYPDVDSDDSPQLAAEMDYVNQALMPKVKRLLGKKEVAHLLAQKNKIDFSKFDVTCH